MHSIKICDCCSEIIYANEYLRSSPLLIRNISKLATKHTRRYLRHCNVNFHTGHTPCLSIASYKAIKRAVSYINVLNSVVAVFIFLVIRATNCLVHRYRKNLLIASFDQKIWIAAHLYSLLRRIHHPYLFLIVPFCS